MSDQNLSNGAKEPKNRRICHEQLAAILDFLEEHPQLARNKCRPISGSLWDKCADIVNAIGSGPVKSGQKWAKYYSDWKYRVRRKALDLKELAEGPDAPVDGISPMTPLEEKLLRLIGDKTLKGIVFSEPFWVSDSDDDNDFCVSVDPILTENTERNPKNPMTPPLETSAKPPETMKRSKGENILQTLEIEYEGSTEEQSLMTGNDHSVQSDEDTVTGDENIPLFPKKQNPTSSDELVDAVRGVRDELSRGVDVLTQIKNWLMQK